MGRNQGARLAVAGFVLLGQLLLGSGTGLAEDDELADLLDDDDYLEDEILVSDPLEPVNRFFFHVNDTLYDWFMGPVARVYAQAVPEDLRYCFDNAFHNVAMPVRLVNNLLQGKWRAGGREVGRFVINTTVGVAGLADPAEEEFGLQRSDEDLGQTLGSYGVGQGFFLYLPFLGPSSARDGFGLVGDFFVSPTNYVLRNNAGLAYGLTAWRVENSLSIHGQDYEDLREQAFDPYISFRDFYLQHRQALVEDATETAAESRGSTALPGDCQNYQPRPRLFNLVEARMVMACAKERGEKVYLTKERQGNRIVFGVEYDSEAVQ